MDTARVILPNKYTDERDSRCYLPKRYIVTFLCFWGFFNVFALRANLSVALVAMVNTSTADASLNATHSVVECPNLVSEKQSAEAGQFVGEQYDWDTRQQGFVLSAFFYGYIVTQMPGGVLSQMFGAKWLFGVGVFLTAVFSLLSPFAARWGIAPFIVLRVLIGLSEGITCPAMNIIISRWSPKLERSRVSTIIFTGSQIGTVLSMTISGWLCSTDLMGGWPSVFYVFGAVGCIWFLFWAVLVSETPAQHPSISKKELKCFQMNSDEESSEKKQRTPWKAIVTSLPVWAVVAAHFGHNFGFLMLLTELPTYLSTVLHFDLKENGLLSSLPYIVQAVAAWTASYIADRLRRSNKMSVTNIRKLCNCIGFFGPAICFVGVTLCGCRPQLIVALISLAMALNGFIYSGFNVTHVDMSPGLAGTLFGFTNTFSNVSGILGPAFVGVLTNSGATIASWSEVFYITAGVYVVTGSFFAVFVSAELQPWSKVEEEIDDDIPVKDIRFLYR